MKRNYERIMYLVNPTECAGHAGVDPGHCSVASHAPGSDANLEATHSDSPGRTDNEAQVPDPDSLKNNQIFVFFNRL